MKTLLSQAKYYLDKPYITIGYDPATAILFNIWNGFASFEEVIQISKRTLEAALFEKPSKVLFDTRNMEVLDEESQQYVSQEFAKQMRDIGIKFSAIVLPEDVFAQDSVDRIKNSLLSSAATEVRYFKQMSAAIKWLSAK